MNAWAQTTDLPVLHSCCVCSLSTGLARVLLRVLAGGI